MLYFFTKEQKKKIASEYRARFFNVLLLFGIGISIFWILSLVPSYILVKADQKSLLQEQATLSSFSSPEEREELNQRTADLKHKLTLIHQSTTTVSVLVSEITKRQIGGIKINVIQYSDNAQEKTILLQGVAGTRDLLVEFGNVLEQSEYFESVDVPVASFARSFDIPFSLTINLTQDEK